MMYYRWMTFHLYVCVCVWQQSIHLFNIYYHYHYYYWTHLFYSHFNMDMRHQRRLFYSTNQLFYQSFYLIVCLYKFSNKYKMYTYRSQIEMESASSTHTHTRYIHPNHQKCSEHMHSIVHFVFVCVFVCMNCIYNSNVIWKFDEYIFVAQQYTRVGQVFFQLKKRDSISREREKQR